MEGINVIDQELLSAVLILRKLPYYVAIHHVLGGNTADRTFQCPADHDVFVNRKFFSFSLTRDGDCIRHVGNFSRQHGLVVRRRRPGEHFRRLRFFVERLHELQGFNCVFGVDGDIAGFILLRTAKRPQQSTQVLHIVPGGRRRAGLDGSQLLRDTGREIRMEALGNHLLAGRREEIEFTVGH